MVSVRRHAGPALADSDVTGAVSESAFSRQDWRPLGDALLLRPELPREKQCIDAPPLLEHQGYLFMFYAGAYNNEPQQIGCARSTDGVKWERVSKEPLLPAGRRARGIPPSQAIPVCLSMPAGKSTCSIRATTTTATPGYCRSSG